MNAAPLGDGHPAIKVPGLLQGWGLYDGLALPEVMSYKQCPDVLTAQA